MLHKNQTTIRMKRLNYSLKFIICFQSICSVLIDFVYSVIKFWFCSEKWNFRNIGSTTLPMLFSRSVVSDSLRPHGLQHIRLPCPLLSPRNANLPERVYEMLWVHVSMNGWVPSWFTWNCRSIVNWLWPNTKEGFFKKCTDMQQVTDDCLWFCESLLNRISIVFHFLWLHFLNCSRVELSQRLYEVTSG